MDGQEIHPQSEPSYRLVEGNLLISDPHAVDHGGVYQCIASNALGTVVSREARVQFACESIPILWLLWLLCAGGSLFMKMVFGKKTLGIFLVFFSVALGKNIVTKYEQIKCERKLVSVPADD